VTLSLLLRAAAGLSGLALVAVIAWLGRRSGRPRVGWLLTGTAGLGALLLAFQGFTLWRQLVFPFQLEAMECTVLDHAVRLAAGEAVYPEPSPEFVALAYNPGLYLLLRPLFVVAPPSLALLRLPAVLAVAALTALLGWLAARASRSWRWGLVAAALFVLATRSLDGYLSTGHGDAPMIACALGGALLLEERQKKSRGLLAAVLLVAAFWLKQPGGVIALGAGLLLLLRDRVRAWQPLALLALLGPAAYLLAGPRLFGPDFLEATLVVPASWSAWGAPAIIRFAEHVLRWWAVPAVVACAAYWAVWRHEALLRDPLLFLWPFAALTGLMGATDLGSNDNVFALFGIWSLAILVREAATRIGASGPARAAQWGIAMLVLCAAFLAHDLRAWLPDSGAGAARADLETLLLGLDGPVYIPWFTPPPGVAVTARAHWVALEDRIRGTGEPEERNGWIVSILKPVATAPAPAYLLLSHRLDKDRLLGWLGDDYVMQSDLGDRFAALRGLPHRFDVGPPRFLYRRLGGAQRGD